MKEVKIVHKKLPDIESELINQIVKFIQSVRQMTLSKPPGVAETLDWAMALLALGKNELDVSTVDRTMGCMLKSTEDIAKLKSAGIENFL